MRLFVPIVPLLVVLAGCAEQPAEERAPGDGHGFAPQQGHDIASDPSVPGVVLDGDLYACDAGHCIEAEARNEGGATYHVSSICVSPWTDRMERDGEPVAHREPMAHCAAFGTQPFRPGETLRHDVTWNGTLWDDASSRYVSAPDGAYEWTVAFRLYEQADGPGIHDLEVSFTTVVGAT